MALAQGSGELIWWPYIVAKYGTAFLFLLIPACLLQFPLTFEVGRYTILTGEGLFRGFFRLNKAFGVGLWILFTISFFWFGAFASAGGTAIAALTDFPGGWDERGQTMFWGQVSIVIFTVAILYAKTAYRLIEWVMKIVAIVSLVGMGIACFHPAVRDYVGEFCRGLFIPDFERMRSFDVAEDTTRLLTAITFAGLGGFWSMFYSYWIKEKGAGMAHYSEKIVGFRSGVSELHLGGGALPMGDGQAPGRLGRWYRFLSVESLIGIVGNIATTLMTCLLALALLQGTDHLPKDYQLAVVQSAFFEVSWGQIGKLLFLFIAGAFLIDTWLATADCVARIQIDAITSIWPKMAHQDLRKWYYGLVLALAVLTSVTMYFDQPGKLIQLSAVIGFLGLLAYATAMVYLNHGYLNRQLTPALRSGKGSLIAICVTLAFYYVLAGAYIYFKWFYTLPEV